MGKIGILLREASPFDCYEFGHGHGLDGHAQGNSHDAHHLLKTRYWNVLNSPLNLDVGDGVLTSYWKETGVPFWLLDRNDFLSYSKEML
jgi:hypothetical protein